jgi:hypothetical protein
MLQTALQRYIGLFAVVSILTGYWQNKLTEMGFLLFMIWIIMCAVILLMGGIFLVPPRSGGKKMGVVPNLCVAIAALATYLLFELFKV